MPVSSAFWLALPAFAGRWMRPCHRASARWRRHRFRAAHRFRSRPSILRPHRPRRSRHALHAHQQERHECQRHGLRRDHREHHRCPTADGKLDDVVLGFDKFAPYLTMNGLLRRDHRPLRQPHRQGPVHLRQGRLPITLSTTGRTRSTAASLGFNRRMWNIGAGRFRRARRSALPGSARTARKAIPGNLYRQRHLFA